MKLSYMKELRCLFLLISCSLNLEFTSTSLFPTIQSPQRITPPSILNFWFGGDPVINYKEKWFPRDGSIVQNHTDQVIRDRFADVLRAAEENELSSWEGNPRDLLALIIVLDQFSRHIYRRNRKKIAENDAMALSKAEKMLLESWDLEVC